MYGLGGELVAEYLWTAPTTVQKEYGYRSGQMLIVGESGNVRWLVQDHLGSTRMSVGTSGALASVKWTDYLPFGEEIGAGVGARTTGQGYSQTDCWRQKFTGYERDVETGLDYAQARMYANWQGRFTSVDPLLASGMLDDPQSWCRYNYGLGNPLRFTDPTGLYVFDSSVDDTQRKQFNEAFAKAQEQLKKIGELYKTDSKEYKAAKRALDVYGDPGVDNGVTISGAQLGTKVAGHMDPVVGVRKDGKAKINLTIDKEEFSSSNLMSTIAHEGSHAADAAAFALDKKSTSPTTYRTEFDAYGVTSLFLEASGKVPLMRTLPGYKTNGIWHLPEPYQLWNTSWGEVDKAVIREKNINTLLGHPTRHGGQYGVSAKSQGGRAFVRRK